jgi:hypothetical protein
MDTVILFDNLTIEQRARVWAALEDLDVDFITLVTLGAVQRFNDGDVSAHELRNLQAQRVGDALRIARALDNDSRY